VPEDLLDADVNALLQQERGRGVPGVIHARLSDPGRAEEGVPVIPVVMRVERSACGRTEDQVPVCPGRPCGETFGVLASSLIPELSDERRSEWQDEFPCPRPGLTPLRR
jgi:hypothetical protein